MGKATSRILVALVALVATACAHNDARSTTPSAQSLSDAQIVTALITIHQSEVDAARIAETRSMDVNVQGFAVRMQTEHLAAIDRLQALSREHGLTPQGSELSQKLAYDSARAGDRLNRIASHRFDALYLNTQADDHRVVLALLYGELAPSVMDPGLRAEVTSQRDATAHHLDHLETVRAQVAATQQLQRQRASR